MVTPKGVPDLPKHKAATSRRIEPFASASVCASEIARPPSNTRAADDAWTSISTHPSVILRGRPPHGLPRSSAEQRHVAPDEDGSPAGAAPPRRFIRQARCLEAAPGLLTAPGAGSVLRLPALVVAALLHLFGPQFVRRILKTSRRQPTQPTTFPQVRGPLGQFQARRKARVRNPGVSTDSSTFSPRFSP